MTSITIIGGCILIGTALVTDAKGTLSLVTAIITIRGVAFIFKRIVSSLNKDYGEMVNFTSWCLCGVPIIGLIKLAKQGFEPVIGTAQNIYNGFTTVADKIEGVGTWIENLVKW